MSKYDVPPVLWRICQPTSAFRLFLSTEIIVSRGSHSLSLSVITLAPLEKSLANKRPLTGRFQRLPCHQSGYWPVECMATSITPLVVLPLLLPPKKALVSALLFKNWNWGQPLIKCLRPSKVWNSIVAESQLVPSQFFWWGQKYLRGFCCIRAFSSFERATSFASSSWDKPFSLFNEFVSFSDKVVVWFITEISKTHNRY